MKSKIGPNILLTLVVAVALWDAWAHAPTPWTATQSTGACLAVAGFVLWTLARFQLGSSLTVTAQAKQLVTRGLYSKLRNPIYYFGSLTIAGWILVFGRPLWLLIFLVIVPLQIWRAHVESRVLEDKFGDEYRKYRAATWF